MLWFVSSLLSVRTDKITSLWTLVPFSLDSQTMSIWWGNPEFWRCVWAWNALSWIHMCETGCRLNCSRLFRDHTSSSRSPTQPWGTSHTFGMHTHTWHYTTMNQHIRTLKIFPKFSLTSSTIQQWAGLHLQIRSRHDFIWLEHRGFG